MTPEDIAAQYLSGGNAPAAGSNAPAAGGPEAIAAQYLGGGVQPPVANAPAAPAEAPTESFLDRSSNTLQKGLSEARERFDLAKSKTNLPEPNAEGEVYLNPIDIGRTKVRQALGGDILPAVGEVTGDAIMTAGKHVLPKAVQDSIKEVYEFASESELAKLIDKGLTKWRESSPETYDAAGEYANIASVIAPIPKIPGMQGGTQSRQKLTQARAEQRKTDVAELLEPDVMVEAPGKTNEKGFTRRQTYTPSEAEVRMYDEVDAIPDVNPRRSNLHNMNAVDAEVGRLAGNLDESLSNAHRINVSTVMKDVEAAVAAAAKSPTFTGDAGAVAKRIYAKFSEIVKQYGDNRSSSVPGYADDFTISPTDLLQARRDLDRWMDESLGTQSLFDIHAGARNEAVSNLRAAINQRVAASSPEIDVTDALRQQSDLLTARDTLRERAATEGRTGLERTVDKVEKKTGMAHPRTPYATAANASSLPAMAVTAGGMMLAGGGRLVKSTARTAATKTLESIEATVNAGGTLTKQMAADRAAALAVLNAPDEQQAQ